jgi:hypothetical protein
VQEKSTGVLKSTKLAKASPQIPSLIGWARPLIRTRRSFSLFIACGDGPIMPASQGISERGLVVRDRDDWHTLAGVAEKHQEPFTR